MNLRKQLCVAMLLAAATAAGGAGAVLPGVPAPPQTGVRAVYLMDFHSGEVLADANSDMAVEPASLTKIMTVYVAATELRAGRLTLDEEVVVSEKAWRTEGSRMFIEVGKRVSVRDLMRGIIVQSGNDASVALAEHISGDETVFAALMNQHAARLGLNGTSFGNSTGLPDSSTYTTALDLAKLSAALIREFPDVYAGFAERQFEFNDIRQPNRNRLLYLDDSVDGIKTGHTDAAGYCLVASAQRDGMRLISVVLGAETEDARTRASQALLSYGFRFFETHRLYGARETVATSRVWKGAEDAVALGPQDVVHLTIPRGRYGDLDIRMMLDSPLIAPIAADVPLGQLEVQLDDTSLRSIPLVALGAVPEGGLLTRMTDSVRLWFE